MLFECPPPSKISENERIKRKCRCSMTKGSTFSWGSVPAGQTLHRILSLHIYGGGKIYLNRDMKKTGRSDYFPEETSHGSS